MSKPAAIHVDDALDELVNQFSDPLSFYRELIQNALDAGSTEVEIWFEFDPDASGKRGAAVIHVDDFGAGMNREIIETRLTRLFSSAKDGDATMIGKFGIGFVSVFAIEPDAVCVDTSRESEHWRVLFDKDRRFTLLRRDEPLDGTKIHIYKTMTKAEYDDFVRRSSAVIRYWCRHVPGEVRVAGESICEPLQLGDPCRVEHDDGVTAVTISHPVDGQTFAGFYNRGLTLIEDPADGIDGLAFKVSSTHLEHTLTRDNVIRDEGYVRVREIVDRMVWEKLRPVVFERLEDAVSSEQDDAQFEYLCVAATWHARRWAQPDDAVAQRQVFRTPAGERVSVRDVEKAFRATQEILFAPLRSPISDALETDGKLVLHLRDDHEVDLAVALAGGGATECIDVGQRYCLPLPTDDEPWRALLGAVFELVRAAGGKLREARVGQFEYPGSSVADRVVLSLDRFDEIDEVSEASQLGMSLLSGRKALVINAGHETARTLARVAAAEPELAAYQLAKLFFVRTGLDDEIDATMLATAWERRCQRSKN